MFPAYIIVLFSLPQTLSEILFYSFTYLLFAYLVSPTRLLDPEEQRPFLLYSLYSQRLVHSSAGWVVSHWMSGKHEWERTWDTGGRGEGSVPAAQEAKRPVGKCDAGRLAEASAARPQRPCGYISILLSLNGIPLLRVSSLSDQLLHSSTPTLNICLPA